MSELKQIIEIGPIDYGDGLFSFGGALICAKKLITLSTKQWPTKGEGNKVLLWDYGDYYIETTETYSAGDVIESHWKRIYKIATPATSHKEEYIFKDHGDGLFTLGECVFVMRKIVAMEVNEYEAKADFGNWVLVVKAGGDKSELRDISWERIYKEGCTPPDTSEIIVEDLGDGLISFGGSILATNVKDIKASYYEAQADCGDYLFIVTVSGEGNNLHNIQWKRVYKAEAGGNNG